MQEAKDSYRPVYHFQDNYLLEVFLRSLPRSVLLDPFRNNESLRNRYFRGFRISNTLPLHQLVAAYRKEIIDRCNGKLGSFLCAIWIAQQGKLVATALETLGVASNEPANTATWLAGVHSKLASDGYNVQPLVRTLGQQFPEDDVRILISIIGYNADQEKLRQMVDDELQQKMSDPYLTKERLEVELQRSEGLLNSTQKSLAELEPQEHNETTAAQALLEQMVDGHDTLATQLANEDAAVQALTKQISDLRAALNEQQRAYKTTTNRKEQLSKSIDRQRKHLSATQDSFGKRRRELELRVQDPVGADCYAEDRTAAG